MLKAAVFSDTHGSTAPMLEAARGTGADVLIHLGDYDRDAQALREAFPDTPLFSVCGNCDVMPQSPEKLVVPLGPVRALLTHGHRYGVSAAQADWLVYAAREAGAQIAMFGHTHSAYYETIGGVTLLNPGSAGRSRTPSWALVTVFDNGAIACEIKPIA